MMAATLQAQVKGDGSAGKGVYQKFCVVCHGAGGQGDGAASAALNPKPRNFQDAAYMNTRSDADLKKVVQLGGAAVGKSPAMPPWGSSLKEKDIADVIAYIRLLGKK